MVDLISHFFTGEIFSVVFKYAGLTVSGDRPGFLDLLSCIQYSHVSHCNLRQQKAVPRMELATEVDVKGLQCGLVTCSCPSSDCHGRVILQCCKHFVVQTSFSSTEGKS